MSGPFFGRYRAVKFGNLRPSWLAGILLGRTKGSQDDIDSLRRASKRLMIASFPKCGSTYLLHVLSGLPGFERAELLPATGLRGGSSTSNLFAVSMGGTG